MLFVLLTASAQDARIVVGETPEYPEFPIYREGVDKTLSVGAMILNRSATPSGGVAYSYPIYPGPCLKLSPQITIDYNSQSSEGLAGYGWHLGGISSIQLTGGNLYYDNKVEEIDLNSIVKRFTLDGVRLVANKQTDLKDEYPLITVTGNVMVKPHQEYATYPISHFSVIYPDGRKATYGWENNTENRLSYPITELQDIYGNKIVFSYHTSGPATGNQYVIKEILYNFGTQEYASTAVNSIQFLYDDITSSTEKYIAGIAVTNKKLLKSISCKEHNLEKERIYLTHEKKDSVYFLRRIDVKRGGSRLNPVSFSYSYETESEGLNNTLRRDTLELSTFFPDSEDTIVRKTGKFLRRSFNDGIISYPLKSNYALISNNNSGRLYGSTYNPDQSILLIPNVKEAFSPITFVAEEGLQDIGVADIDGDGIEEIVKVNSFGFVNGKTRLKISLYKYDDTMNVLSFLTYFSVYIEGNVVHKQQTSPIQIVCDYGNLLGDGRQLLMVTTANKDPLGNARTSHTTLIDLEEQDIICSQEVFDMDFESDKVSHIVLDIDNDGQDEICYPTDAGLNIYSYNAPSGFSLERVASGMTASAFSDRDKLFCTDMNKDGYVDFVVSLGQSDSTAGTFRTDWRIFKFTGTDFVQQDVRLNDREQAKKYLVLDIDKDGQGDLLKITDLSVYLYRNEKGCFRDSPVSIIGNIRYPDSIILQNLNSPKRYSDFITMKDGTIYVYDYGVDYSYNNLLTKSVDSYGISTINTYKNMTDSEHRPEFDPYRTYSANYVRRLFPLQILSRCDIYSSSPDTGRGDVKSETYTYTDPITNITGLGFVGFGAIQVKDNISGLMTFQTNDPELLGVPKEIRMTYDRLNYFNISINTYVDERKYKFPNPLLLESVNTDTVTGKTSTTTYVYDSLDFATSVTKTITIDSQSPFVTTSLYKYRHNFDKDKYVLGLVTQEDQRKTMNGSQWMERVLTSYDSTYLYPSRCDYEIVNNGYVRFRTQKWTYNLYGSLIKEQTSEYGSSVYNTITYSYDLVGTTLLSVTDALGQTVSYSDYGWHGKPSTITDHKGRVTTKTYDDWGNLRHVTYPDGRTKQYTYSWGDDCMYEIHVLPSDAPCSYKCYDALGREIESGAIRFDGINQITNREYDDQGRLQREILPYKPNTQQQAVVYSYDVYGRPSSVMKPNGEVVSWTYNKNRVTETKSGVSVVRTTDSMGNVVSISDPGGTISYAFRADGQPSSVTAPGNVVTTFLYDVYGRRIRITDPSAGVQQDAYTHNSDGSYRHTHTNPNGSVITDYDRYGRVTSVQRPGEYTTSYTYNTDGLLVSEVSTNGTGKAYSYDGYDRLIGLVETVPDGVSLTTSYAYGSSGLLTSTTYTGLSGRSCVEGYQYACGHHVATYVGNTCVWQLTGENSMGLPVSATTLGVLRRYEYDAFGLPTKRTMQASSGTIIQHMSYSFDPLKGNLMSRTDNKRGMTETFGYDEMNRLVQVNNTNITYQDNGNIISKPNVGTLSYDDASHPYRVTSLNASNPSMYTTQQSVSYTCYSRPSRIEDNGLSASFTYNADGERVKMAVASGATKLLDRYYVGGRYEADIKSSKLVERLYIQGDAYNAPVVLVSTNGGVWQPYNIGRDYLGSITHVTTATGGIVEEYSYDPWGRLRNPTNYALATPNAEPELMLGRGYTGHEHLPWFGLINMNARLYDPVLGRFLSPDPFVQMPNFTQNFNRYSYCLNNPLVYVDENGEYAWAIVGAIGGILNLISNWDNIDGFLDWLSTFAVGFSAGALAVVSGGSSIGAAIGVGAATSAVTSFNNEMVAQTGANFTSDGNINWDNVWMSTVSGAVAGAASGAVGSWASSANITVNDISSPLLNSAVTSTMSAGAGHIAGGTSYNLMSGQGLSEAFQNSLYGVGKSILLGGVIGMGTTTATCLATGINPLTGVSITSKDLNLDLSVQRIQNKESYPHKNDGAVFKNNEGYLPPSKDPNYYREYVHPTPGVKGPGPQRIITGSRGEWYYTPDHYKTFIRFVP